MRLSAAKCADFEVSGERGMKKEGFRVCEGENTVEVCRREWGKSLQESF